MLPVREDRQSQRDGLHAWPRYGAGDDRFVVFGEATTNGTAFRTAQLDFLNTAVGR